MALATPRPWGPYGGWTFLPFTTGTMLPWGTKIGKDDASGQSVIQYYQTVGQTPYFVLKEGLSEFVKLGPSTFGCTLKYEYGSQYDQYRNDIGDSFDPYNPPDNYIIERRFKFFGQAYTGRFYKDLNPQTGWTYGLKAYRHAVVTTMNTKTGSGSIRWTLSDFVTKDHVFSDADNRAVVPDKPFFNPTTGQFDPDWAPAGWFSEWSEWLPATVFQKSGDTTIKTEYLYTGSARPPGVDSDIPPPDPLPDPPPPLPPEEPTPSPAPWFIYKLVKPQW